MELFLFLDDWLIDDYQDINRQFCKAQLTINDEPFQEMNSFYGTVLYFPEKSLYRTWYVRFVCLKPIFYS